ncbi:hypothetical protein [Streptomyces sp. NPDC056948]|uniref:hypothetical protein n=1 Tax=Streptomyces sp. NPDC056948 TaxID=3345975 RepID=UPI00363EEF2C
MTSYDLQVMSTSGQMRKVRVSHPEEPPWTLRVADPQGRDYCGKGQDLYEALRQVRVEMEGDCLMLCCNGARKNAHPSPSMSAAGADFVYLTPAYRVLTLRDIFPLLGPAPPSSVVTVEEQKDYYAAKLMSRMYLIQWCNPVSWVKVLEAAFKGPRDWQPEISQDGVLAWHC